MSALGIRQDLAEAHVRALDSAAALRMEAARFDEEAARTAAELRKLMAEGEALRVDDVEVVLAPAKPNGRRSVDRDAIHAHIETLEPLGLGPVEEQKTSYRYPSVAELERRAYQLGRCGIGVETLIETPPLGEPQVVIRQRDGVSA